VRVSRLSYEQVEQCLGEAPFAQLWEIAQRYRERRRAQGAAFIALPEAQVRVVGAEVTIRALPRLRSRELVMEAMLMAGEAAASFALERDLPFPYSTQPPPEERQEPASLAAMYAYRRRLRRSQMKSVPEPHAGLGLESYAQVTSPLRRYLDLVAHQQIRAYLAGRPLLGAQEVLARVGAAEAVIGNVRKAERSSVRHWTLVYLMQRPDWTGEGVLVDRAEHRGVVLIPHLALETRVRVPPDVPLDGRVELALTGVDLPELAAFFRVEGVIR
jgi:exoribonuclease-2